MHRKENKLFVTFKFQINVSQQTNQWSSSASRQVVVTDSAFLCHKVKKYGVAMLYEKKYY